MKTFDFAHFIVGRDVPHYKWVGLDGEVVGLASFGESGAGGQVMEHFGFSVGNVVAVVKGIL